MTFQLPMFISSGSSCVLRSRARTVYIELPVNTHWVHPWSSRLGSSSQSYTIFEMRQKIGRSGMAKKLGPDVGLPHTVLTSVTVSVSDDEVHLVILRDFVHTLVKRD